MNQKRKTIAASCIILVLLLLMTRTYFVGKELCKKYKDIPVISFSINQMISMTMKKVSM